MKKFILLIVALFTVASATESEITKKLKEYKIIPNIIKNNVPELLKITFDSGESVNMGNIILPTQAKNQPIMVDWNADKNAYYTIMSIGPDYPSPEDPFMSYVLLWKVGNIPGKDINSGQVLAEYFPFGPPRGANLNRGIFLLFKQPSKLHFDYEPSDKYTVEGRVNFPFNEFVERYGLGEPVAANFYMTKFDSYVMEIFKKFNCCFELNKPEE
ncbi:protein D3-like [Episyrphus balteatus]|uniref:protein D3-like n=1 Tax=Episyrphus balteatus TaxID=286459 RepID=UPI0024850538|nr:protein D3-like [Episyrphus balteatus]